jgi:hypothetical protein
MPWTPHLTTFEGELLKTRISSQEEIDTTNEREAVKKEEYREDRYNRMGQGKSSPASIAVNQVTLKETVDSRSKEVPTINKDKGHHAPDKGIPMKKSSMLLKA